ncbi:uncharacterized protein Dwil_GK23464 [Drosophila willistoni]|uniref:Calcium release-activated calcium channel protein 1 n=1 Tax=Drosophila willistoni TaxID=7260 RepID=B4NP52_DROWI|nr:uncharacterized protein Dwil_GK23464 [Drosophila willistoni]
MPRVLQQEYSVQIIRPTITNNQQLDIPTGKILVGPRDTFIISRSYQTMGNSTICKESDLTHLDEDSCLPRLIKGGTAKCHSITNTASPIELLEDGTIFTTNFKGQMTNGVVESDLNENPSEHRLDPHEGITNILDDSFPKDSGKELGSKHQIHRSSLVKLRISERKVKRILLHLIRDGAGRKCFSYTRPLGSTTATAWNRRSGSGFKRSSLGNSLVQFPPPPPPSSTGPNLPKPRHHRTGSSSMSQSGEDLHSPTYLSWRKLQLSRAKLKASSKTSALLSGFAMVAMVEVQLNNDTKVPNGMLVAFAICTTMLVAVHMLALMISTCILPNIETVCNLHSISLVHESPHERLHWYIETAWAFSTLLGLILILLEIAILCWVKFYDLSPPAAWSACIVLIPVMIIFLAFAVHFYRSLVTHKYEVTVSGIRELEMLKEQMEQDHLEHHNNTRNNGLHYGASGDIV